MKRFEKRRSETATILAALALGLLATVGGRAGGTKGGWKPFVPEAAYQTLTERSLKTAEEQAKSGGDKALARLRAEAIVLAGLVSASEKGDDVERQRLRQNALAVAQQAGEKKGTPGELAGQLRNPKELPGGTKLDWRSSLDDLGVLMDLFRTKAKGGEGLTPELQYTAKLKNLNGSEDLIGALAAKKLTDANLAKTAKELELFGYRTAILGAITHAYAPETKTKMGEPKDWRELSDQMRDASLALAQAARSKDGAAIQEAASKLQNTCTACHSKFR